MAASAPTHECSVRELLFVEEVWRDPSQSGASAIIKAGYSEKGAAVQANRLLNRPRVQKALAALNERHHASAVVNQRWLVERLINDCSVQAKDVIDEVTGAVLPIHQWPTHVQRMVASVTVEEVLDTIDGKTLVTGFLKKVTFESRGSRLQMIGKAGVVGAFAPDQIIQQNVLVLQDYSGGRGGARPDELGPVDIKEVGGQEDSREGEII